jgi:hypothetical protein
MKFTFKIPQDSTFNEEVYVKKMRNSTVVEEKTLQRGDTETLEIVCAPEPTAPPPEHFKVSMSATAPANTPWRLFCISTAPESVTVTVGEHGD